MLSKINRLTKKKDFEAVFKNGKSLKKYFLLFRILKNNLKESRFGFVVSKKISNKATVRNKVKRRLRSAVLGQFKKNKLPADNWCVDLVIIALPGIEKKEFSEIREIIKDSFKKIGII